MQHFNNEIIYFNILNGSSVHIPISVSAQSIHCNMHLLNTHAHSPKAITISYGYGKWNQPYYIHDDII